MVRPDMLEKISVSVYFRYPDWFDDRTFTYWYPGEVLEMLEEIFGYLVEDSRERRYAEYLAQITQCEEFQRVAARLEANNRGYADFPIVFSKRPPRFETSWVRLLRNIMFSEDPDQALSDALRTADLAFPMSKYPPPGITVRARFLYGCDGIFPNKWQPLPGPGPLLDA